MLTKIRVGEIGVNYAASESVVAEFNARAVMPVYKEGTTADDIKSKTLGIGSCTHRLRNPHLEVRRSDTYSAFYCTGDIEHLGTQYKIPEGQVLLVSALVRTKPTDNRFIHEIVEIVGLVSDGMHDEDVLTFNPQPAEILETCVYVKSEAEYQAVRGLYLKAGAYIWPWHKGLPKDHDGEVFLVGVEECGFMKHMHAVSGGAKVITMTELATIAEKLDGITAPDGVTGRIAAIRKAIDAMRASTSIEFIHRETKASLTVVAEEKDAFVSVNGNIEEVKRLEYITICKTDGKELRFQATCIDDLVRLFLGDPGWDTFTTFAHVTADDFRCASLTTEMHPRDYSNTWTPEKDK